MKEFSYRRYILAFVIAVVIMSTVIVLTNIFGQQKLGELTRIQDTLSTDILSIQTEFDLLQETTCNNVQPSTLSDELNELGNKLNFAESQENFNSDEVTRLKKFYSLLEIKDYLLNKKITEKCKRPFASILYFYTNTDCEACQRQSLILSELRRDIPGLRVYSFDANLDLGAVKTLKSMYKASSTYPFLVTGTSSWIGLTEYETLEKNFAGYVQLVSSSTSTTTKTLMSTSSK